MSKEIRTLFFQKNEPVGGIKANDLWIAWEWMRPLYYFNDSAGRWMMIDRAGMDFNLKYIKNNKEYQYVQHHENQIEMLDLTTLTN